MAAKEIAKFACGFETFHALLHTTLFLTGERLAVFGIQTTPGLNVAGAGVSAVIALGLGIYGWRSIGALSR